MAATWALGQGCSVVPQGPGMACGNGKCEAAGQEASLGDGRQEFIQEEGFLSR
jgi:hypothetical protein